MARSIFWWTGVNSHVEIAVHDTGIGISHEFLPAVFERFRQADASTTRSHGGLGLGLSIVKTIVELHGGSVKAKSPGVGKGAKFTVALPRIGLHGEESGDGRLHPTSSNGVWIECDPDLAGVNILVVDDEQDGCLLVRRLLEECKAQVEVALSARDALEHLDSRKFDILISDIGMPVEDGYQLIQQIRQEPGDNQRIPALALTAFARSEDRHRAALAGFQKHLSKPVEANELIAVVASLAGKTLKASKK